MWHSLSQNALSPTLHYSLSNVNLRILKDTNISTTEQTDCQGAACCSRRRQDGSVPKGRSKDWHRDGGLNWQPGTVDVAQSQRRHTDWTRDRAEGDVYICSGDAEWFIQLFGVVSQTAVLWSLSSILLQALMSLWQPAQRSDTQTRQLLRKCWSCLQSIPSVFMYSPVCVFLFNKDIFISVQATGLYVPL